VFEGRAQESYHVRFRGSEFERWGFGFRVQGSGFRVLDFELPNRLGQESSSET